ncbi:polymorphic toxin type 27 domain-containing protein [Streptomyces sp. NBC_00247]|uniref:polymorphic toxin type 27 domain-containing protein n=1 Tax=Streptomyces sp. NBC_00247 TaxID=2975689 RepID=UPI002E2E07BD|nr:polymorphic toxin type 27 domain-containing protein [Streptomyces sp. NBC_00247]
MAVLAGLITAVPASAAGAEQEEDTGLFRNTIGDTVRQDRCLAGVALHAGGPRMKAKAVEGLSGSAEQLRSTVGDVGWIGFYPLGLAGGEDQEAGLTYRDDLRARSTALEDGNKPFASNAFYSDEMDWHIPEFDSEVLQFTLFTQEQLSWQLGWDGHTNASPEAVARVREIMEENRGQDVDNDWIADWSFRDEDVYETRYSGGTTAGDVASYLKFGGLPTKAPAEGSPEYRVVVEDLKQAWAGCDWQNPLDFDRVLNGPVMTAMAEWELEYAGQAAQRDTIIQAETDAANETREATDDMIQAIQQAWRADQILTWQKVVAEELANDPDFLFKPEPELYEQAEADLADARAKADELATSANSHAAAAKTAATSATTAQQEAWALADTAKVPRGRGLMYAQQSVQVARASAAAAEAAAKATGTARDATDAAVGTSRTLAAKAQTETHALNTEFRRIAAQEAAAQAKAAADSAETNAKAAADSAKDAGTAEAAAKGKQEVARQKAAVAQTQRASAELEYANAVASRAEAARQRTTAAGAETRAATQQAAAGTAKASAKTAATDAATKREAADAKARAAQAAREKAAAAQQKQQATAARAAALEAAAAAADGKATAEETRAAAQQAHQAATDAATAAATARGAAETATAAAVSARSAATKAEGAAGRAQADADAAWSAYLASTGAAASARAEAAKALDAAGDAALRAQNAATASDQASALAKRAGDEAASAGVEAAQAVDSAAVTAGRAYAAGQAALAARDSATKAVAASADAVALGMPYQESDSAAAFAVLTGQKSKTVAEQQAAAAAAKAAEAEQAAEDAQQLADQAQGDVKVAAEAAAQAAGDSARAITAAATAQTSAQAAAVSREGAKKAADTASGYAQQAGNDALSAQQTANSTDTVAGDADREATDAERDALKAAEADDRAAQAAAEAKAQADKADKDAQEAEDRASDADGDSAAAEEAADQAEKEQREENEQQHQQAMEEGDYPIPGGPSSWAELGEQQEAILLAKCGQSCVDDYRDAYAAVSVHVLDWVAAHGGQILLDDLGVAEVKECLSYSGVESCLWDLVDIASSAVVVGRIPALAAAIEQVSAGIQQVFTDADDAQRKLTELTELIGTTRSTARLDRCIAGVALHAGGPEMKAEAITALSGTNADLRAAVGDIGWIGLEPLGQARTRDVQAAFDYRDALAARSNALEKANKPYAESAFFSDDMEWHVPAFDEEVLQFTLFTQEKISGRLGWDGHSNAGAESVARAKEITEDNRGKDSWYDWTADVMLRDSEVANTRYAGGTTGSDIASYLRHGGFLTEAPAKDSPEFREEVENLKQSWATCDSAEPTDPRNKLSAVTAQAHTEWEAEYAAQAAPRTLIAQAEADASAATREATDDMVEAIGQAWRAQQILTWQQVWHDTLEDDPDNIFKPKQALFDRAKADLATARGKIAALTASAKTNAAAAKTAAQKAVDAQEDAWAIADAAEVPRGRGLMYAQQSVQVARASGAAAEAAAKATETSLNAANATVSTSEALLALAKTETHAVNTEFRRVAAEEAAAQAKAAADSADAYAASAAANAATAKKAKETALAEEEDARQAAADAQASRAVAELERANAAAYRATAESERDKASASEAEASAQGRIASDARTSAEAAGSTASARRGDAEQAERDAVDARGRALEAEQRRDSLSAKAAALEAHAAAVDGTDAAEAARAAATDARAAANTATTAATNARAAANAATTAATTAREAATKAQGAASRAQAASDATWASYLVAVGSAAAAHAAAAEAIDASEAAALDAKGAKEQSEKASAAAKKAKEEATAARSEALQTASWAAVTAGKALAAVQSSLAARDSAAAVIKPANEAITLGTPYQETDSSAAFATLTGQQALTVSQQQAAAATATADMAEGYSAEAKALAAQAAADMKLAAQASAAAAADAARAAKAYQRAQASATQAAKDAKLAEASANRADGYVQSAGADVVRAWTASNDAATDAAAADAAATEAEHDAASARATATKAEEDAASARDTATQAETDATAAEKASEGAWDAANEAQQAADRTEKADNTEHITQGATTGIGGVWEVLDHVEYIGDPKNVDKDNCNPIVHIGDCTITADVTYKSHSDVFMCLAESGSYSGSCPQADTVYLGPEVSDARTERMSQTLTMVEFNSGIDPIDILLGDFIGCAKLINPFMEGGSWGDCAWVVGMFAVGALFKAGKVAVTALDASLKTGIGFMDAFRALRAIGLTEGASAGIISRILRKIGEACEAEDIATFRVVSFSVAASGDGIVKKCARILADLVKDGDHVVLGINPYSDDLAKAVGGGTFNNKELYGIELPESMGMGKRAIWTVGVERAVSNPKVELSVTLDGVEGAKNADEALALLLERGDSITDSSWKLIQDGGFGTAWEMVKLRAALRVQYRTWDSIKWYMTKLDENGKKVFEQVYPKRLTYANGTPVD